ncbi:MAG: cell division protein FtsL [Pseudomonadota bacterium]|jgi:hypothetical protein
MRVTRFTVILLVIVAAVGSLALGLYTREKEQQAERLLAQISRDRGAIHVLEAELAYLVRPQRLQSLAGAHFNLRPPLPAQIYPDVAQLPAEGAKEDGREVQARLQKAERGL